MTKSVEIQGPERPKEINAMQIQITVSNSDEVMK